MEQVRDLLGQYTDEVGQAFAPEVIESIHKQTAGQPCLVNRMASILTEERKIPLSETINRNHFEIAHKQILNERNVHLSHLTTNIRRDARGESLLMRISLKEEVVPFNLDNQIISELFTYGFLRLHSQSAPAQ
ncbi:hypothetical protein FJZ31_08305 [Candidatus Poribacteria bacterium]|nr:hypothetical protein [Candidatus Poribacteria bacterium]